MKKKVLLSLIVALLLNLSMGLFSSLFATDVKDSTQYNQGVQIVLAEADGSEGAGDGSGGGSTENPGEPTLSQSEINKLFQKGHVVSPTNHIKDSILYGRLLDVVTEYAKTLGYAFTGDELYSEMFTSYAVEDKLFNITEIVIQDDLIESLEGLEYLRLDNIKKFVVSSNKLTSINASVFQNMENLEYLSFANNAITTCDISSLKNLKYVNLSSNKMSSIDLSNIITANIEINLANNNFNDMSKIKLPTRAHSIKLDIFSNNLREIPEEYFNLTKLSLKIGVQGIKKFDSVSKIDTATSLRVYKLNSEDLRLVVYKKINLLDREIVKTITDDDITGNYLDIPFVVGDYVYEFEKLSASEYYPAYDKYDEVGKIYAPQEFQVIPQMASYVYEYKGKTYESLGKVTGLVKIHLTCEEGGKIYYYNSNYEWVEGDVIECNGGGSRVIQVKVIKDGYESEVQNIKVETSLNKYIPDFLMFAIVFAIALVLFLVVIPIVSKKFFKK